MRKISLLFLAVIWLASCSQEVIDNPAVPHQEGVKVPISFNTTPMETKIVGDKGVDTRSVATTDVDENTIINMWVFQFDKDGNFIKKVYNPSVNKDASDAPLVATPASQVSHLYFLANAGASIASPDNENTFLTQFKPIYTENDVFFISDGKKYLPMFGSKLDAVIPYTGFIDKLDVSLTRMVSKVKVICNVDDIALAKLNIESAALCNVPMGIQFCPPTGGTPLTTTPTFKMNPEAVTLTSKSATLLYYLPENLRGIGTNTAGGERLKIGVDGATYVEIIGRTVGFNGGEEVGFRVYPGADITNDYNLTRNTSYEITATLKDISTSDQRVRVHERSNCYIVAPGGTVKIPAKHANDSPELGIQIPDVTGTWTPSVYWQTAAGLVTVARTAGDGFFTVTAPSTSVEGNALVCIKDAGGNVLWSWHIWVMKADINYPTNQFAGNGFTFMDRNLGATDPGVYGTTYTLNYATSGGLLYQWGRKDPFTIGTATGTNVAVTPLFNAAGTAFLPNATIYTPAGLGATQSASNDPYTYYLDVANAAYGYDKALALSIKYPNLHLANWIGSTGVGTGTSVNLNATNGSDSWGDEYGQPKSVYDPCPEGWRVPSFKKANSSVAATLFGGSQGITSAMTASMTSYNYITVGTSAMLFPFVGWRAAASGVISGVGSNGYWWGATALASTRNAYCTGLSISPTYMNQTNDLRSISFSVRCAKNW